MSLDKSPQFPALWLLVDVGQQYKVVNTVIGAADILVHDWPPNVGMAYLRALEACQDALRDNGPIDAVPEALMRAADESFVCYIRVIGGGKRPDHVKFTARAHQDMPTTTIQRGF